ncbi:MAG: glycosyltransferase family 2 protein [Patescibacteria group bacterium]|jgi:dolichol-phosphate mannosyltransferase
MNKLLSIIIPICNEQDNIPLIYQALMPELNRLGSGFSYEIIFVNDGSIDQSLEKINELTKIDSRVSYLDFSRNFGKEIAVTAGLHNAKGEAAIIIDADLQHPVELIPQFVEKWQAGAEMVIGVREKSKRSGLIKKVGSLAFYKIMDFIGETKISARATDFRLIDRKVINEFNRFTEHGRIARGLLDWLGFSKDYIYFTPNQRANGQASYNRLKLLHLSVSAFISHSLFPLKFAGYLGVLIILFSGPLGLFIFIDKYILGDVTGFNFSGSAILAVINLFMTGIILSCLGLIALYIGSIQSEAMNRPLYIVREKKNFNR